MHLSSADWAYVDERARDFTGREWVFDRVREFLASDGQMLVIAAPPGTGKTAIAARLVQASAGRLAVDAPPILPGTIDAAILCRAGRVTLLEVAQDLSDQLAGALPGFHEQQAATVARATIVSDIDVRTGLVLPGASVTGVRIDLSSLGAELAFDDGVALPLRRLASAQNRPAVLLIDSLDEAFASAAARGLPGRLRGLAGSRLILTTRADARVLAELGVSDRAGPAGRSFLMQLVTDVPTYVDDVGAYARRRLEDQGSQDAMDTLAGRIAEASQGNFLYARYLIDELVASGALVDLDIGLAKERRLPQGLSDVYRDYLGRELAKDLDRWRRVVRPILAPLAVAMGDGLDTAQLASVGGVLAGRPLSVSDVRDVTSDAGQFLQGPRPDGPFRPYHQSFAEFLLSAEENPDWPIDAAEAHAAVVQAMSPSGSQNWTAAPLYARSHLAAHAAACGRLDAILTDPGFLAAADVDRLLPLLWDISSHESRAAAAVVQLASANLRLRPPEERASVLELAARLRGANDYADRIAELHPDRPWSVPRAHWHAPAVHVPFFGHDGWVTSVAVGEVDGRPIAISSDQLGTVRVWDLRTLAPVGVPIVGHEHEVSVAIGLVDHLCVVITGGGDGKIRVWDLRTFARLGASLRAHEGSILGVCFAEIDHRPVAISAGEDGTVRQWDLRTFEPIGKPLRASEHAVRALAVGVVDNRRVVVTSGGGSIQVWDLNTHEPLGMALEGHPGGLQAVSFGTISDRPAAVSGGYDGTVRVWDLQTFTQIGEPLSGDDEGVRAVVLAKVHGRPAVVASGEGGTIQIWDAQTRASLIDPLRGHEGSVLSLAVGDVDHRPVIVSGGMDESLRVWDLDSIAPKSARLEGFGGSVHAVAVGEVAKWPVAITGRRDGAVQLWDLRTLAPLGGPVPGHAGWVRSIAVGEVEGRPFAVSCGDDEFIWEWDLDQFAPLGEPMRGHEHRVWAVAVGSIDGRPIAVSGGHDGTLRVWDLQTRVQDGEPLRGHDGWVQCVAVRVVDDQLVAVSGGSDHTIRVWDIRSRTQIGKSLRGHRSPVSAVAVCEVDDRPVVVSGGYDATLRTWDFRNRRSIGTPMAGHKNGVNSVAVGVIDDRPVAVSGSFGGSVRVWDLRTSSQVAQIPIPGVTGLALVGQDTIVVSAWEGLALIRIHRLPRTSVKVS